MKVYVLLEMSIDSYVKAATVENISRISENIRSDRMTYLDEKKEEEGRDGFREVLQGVAKSCPWSCLPVKADILNLNPFSLGNTGYMQEKRERKEERCVCVRQ